MNISVSHITTYNYGAPVSYSHNIATLKPRAFEGQKVLDYSIDISSKTNEFSERIDFFGNYITRFSITDAHNKLKVTTKSIIDRDYSRVRERFFSKPCKSVTLESALKMLQVISPDIIDAKQFILDSTLIKNNNEAMHAYAMESFKLNRSVFEATHELMARIFKDFKFVPGFTNISTPLSKVMKEKKGVCQDFAQIAIACLRSIGLPARYMSGYIETLPPPGKEKLVGTDASHAWFAVYIPSFGWVDFDPTNNQIPENQHIVLGWGRDYYDVPPLKGVVYGTGGSKLNVAVDIRSI